MPATSTTAVEHVSAGKARRYLNGLPAHPPLPEQASPQPNQRHERAFHLWIMSNGGFLPPTTYGGGFAPVSGTIGDLNTDGNPDIVSSDVAASRQVVVLLGDDQGGFVPGGTHDVGLFPQTPAVGDLNGDHKPDIVTTSWAASTIGAGRGGLTS